MKKIKKKISSNRAITLIALIITIIIMLILVGTSITMVINSNLIGVAKDAADRTKNKYQEEAGMSQITIGNKTYDSIEDYINGEDEYWKIVYVGPVTTESGQALLVSELLPDLVFSPSNEYKISVTSSEFTGEVQTTPILAGNEGGLSAYLLFCVVNGETVNYSSIEEAYAAMETSEKFTAILTAYVPGTGCMVMVMSKTGEIEYTITEVKQRQRELENPIFEGEIDIISGKRNDLEPYFTLDKTRQYCITAVVNENTVILDTTIGWDPGDGWFCNIWDGTMSVIYLESHGMYTSSITKILGVYDMGPNGIFYEEDGFIIERDAGNNINTLIETPNESYVIPEEVDGFSVDVVELKGLCGRPEFDRVVALENSSGYYRLGDEHTIAITVNNTDFIVSMWEMIKTVRIHT